MWVADGARDGEHVAQIRRAVLPGGVPTAMSWNSPCSTPFAASVVNSSAAGLGVALDECIEPRLVDRHLAALQPLDLGGVHVHADHVIAGIGQAGACHEAHVARAENGDAHELSS